MTTQTLVQGADAGRWEQAIYAFLAEKERRSGSIRTVESYSTMLYRFFGTIGSLPDQVAASEVFGYAHGIGLSGKQGKRELPLPALMAIQQSLEAFGKDLTTMKPEESLWPSSINSARGITSGTFYGNLRRYFRRAGLPPAGVHIFRHSAAKLRRDAGESIEEVSRFLDHSNLAVTTVYLRRLERDQDNTWQHVSLRR